MAAGRHAARHCAGHAAAEGAGLTAGEFSLLRRGIGEGRVRKEVVESVTETRVLPLSENDRIMEVARMLSGSSITPAAIQNAKDLLNN